MVQGFFPAQTKINSFYVPYYCEAEDHEIQELIVRGINFDEGNLSVSDKIIRDVQGKKMEYSLECVPSRDLRCLNLKDIKK